MDQADSREVLVALVAEDDSFTRALLTSLVESLGYEVTSVASGNDAIAALDSCDPDVALLDLDLGEGPTGVDVANAIRRVYPWTSIVLMSSHNSISLVHPSPSPPAQHFQFIVKGQIRGVDDIATAIELANQDLPSTTAPVSATAIRPVQATLLRMIALGLSNEEIAATAGISLKAVERRISRLYRTLGVPSSPSANPRVEASRMYADAKVTVK
ncbi:MAG: response regulator [Candidatus Nanopelagicales bacterium]